MSDQKSYFHDLRDVEPGTWPINGIGGTTLYARGIGTIKIIRKLNGTTVCGEIKDVLYVPQLGVTLISIACIMHK